MSAAELLETLPCGVVSFGDDGAVRATNATLRALLAYDAGELEGRHVETLLGVPGRIFFQTHVYPLLRLQGSAEELFVLLRRKDGGEVGALMNAVRHARGGDTVIDAVIVEVRERRKYEDQLLRARRAADEANARLEEQAVELELSQQALQEQTAELETQQEQLMVVNEELTRAREAADEANHAKSQFLANMSHELRTPLNAIGGYVQLLELGVYGTVTDQQREAFGRIARAQTHLLRLINDVLNLARIEAGRVEYAIEPVPVVGVVASVTPMVEPQMAAKQLAFSSVVAPELVARADREKVQQILINLLTNALKFTPTGGRVTVEADRADAGPVRIHVIDTGVGIGADTLERVFEPFVQVGEERGRRSEGTGLGLSISRDLARGMGGDLSVHSTLGVGSKFTLTLPSDA